MRSESIWAKIVRPKLNRTEHRKKEQEVCRRKVCPTTKHNTARTSESPQLPNLIIARLVVTRVTHRVGTYHYPMASTFTTVPKPFLSLPIRTNAPTLPHQTHLGFRRNSLRINAVSTKWEPAKVVPQADRVLVRLEVLPEKSSGGVLLPKSAVKFERYLTGEVVSVGSEVGEVEPGKKVVFSDMSAYEVDFGTDAKHCFCKESDLLAIVQ